jgi:hypothetical protein
LSRLSEGDWVSVRPVRSSGGIGKGDDARLCRCRGVRRPPAVALSMLPSSRDNFDALHKVARLINTRPGRVNDVAASGRQSGVSWCPEHALHSSVPAYTDACSSSGPRRLEAASTSHNRKTDPSCAGLALENRCSEMVPCMSLDLVATVPLFFRTNMWGLSKWLYDTFTGAAIGAARCSSFVGGGFGLLVASYEGIRWTRRFTWFGPPECNTLRPRVNEVVLLCLSARLRSSLFSLCQPVCVCGVRLGRSSLVTVVCPDLL